MPSPDERHAGAIVTHASCGMRVLVLFIQTLLGISATVCGAMLIAAPDGHLLQLPLGVLVNAPFSDFFWPGLILCFVLGGGHVFALILSLQRAPQAPTAALLMGASAVIWIMVQVIMTDPYFWIQPIIAGSGVAEMLLNRTVEPSDQER